MPSADEHLGPAKVWQGKDRRTSQERRNNGENIDRRSGIDRRGGKFVRVRSAADQKENNPGYFRALDRHNVSVVIPTLNEAKNLPYVLPLIPPWVYELILVDGLSTDGTVKLARKLRPDIHIIIEKKPGKGAALRSGFAAAKGDIIVMFDADGSHDPAEIPLFVGALLAGADFAKGSRFIKGGGSDDLEWYRRLGNWCLKMIVTLNFGGNYSDLCYGYNAFQARSLPKLNLDADGFDIETQINIRALKENLKIREVPSFEAERRHGESYLKTIPDGWLVLKTILKERYRRNREGAV